jgi:hypothetical protein
MTTISKNAVSNGLVGSTVGFGYGAIPPAPSPLTIGTVYPTNNTGAFLTSGSNGTSWTSTAQLSDTVLKVNQSPPELEVKGRVVINGRDLEERLDIIEKVLQIPERDAILERKHPKLKKLYDEYIQALGKYRTFEAIKGEDDVT